MILLSLFLALDFISTLDNGVGLTPPMGWNSWNKFGCAINCHYIRIPVPLPAVPLVLGTMFTKRRPRNPRRREVQSAVAADLMGFLSHFFCLCICDPIMTKRRGIIYLIPFTAFT